MKRLFPSLSIAAKKNPVTCVALVGLMALAGCARPVAQSGMNDPFEKENRSNHAFNVALDQKILKPLSSGGDGRGPLMQGVRHFADNLDVPGDIVNNVLQLRLGTAVSNTLRFAVNTTVGVGGIFDPATAIGLKQDETDFGETLYVWGVDEGHYMELPVLGPSTARDTLGQVVDYVINPVRIFVKAPESYVATAAGIVGKAGSRARHSDTVDSVLYGSADSYAQARLLYLQNRRYELGQTLSDDSFIDPYEDNNGQ